MGAAPRAEVEDPVMAGALLYGAYGYTGALIARRAVASGLRPILAGRRAEALEPLARELGAPWRAFSLDDAGALERGLEGVSAVLHCAGPFSRTAAPMARACLRARCHYLDITGEVAVFEALAAMGAEADERGVALLPGVGFDVVPSDCLAAHVAGRCPGASRLTLAFEALGQPSRGTMLTALEHLGAGGLVRRQGTLTAVPGWHTRRLDLGDGPRAALRIPWGDLATAWRSTGIPDIEVYLVAPLATRALMLAATLGAPVLRRDAVRRRLAARIRARPAGPSAGALARGRSVLWAEARAADGRRAAARLDAPDGYALTADAAVEALRRALDGTLPPGFQTPSRAFGAGFVLELPGVVRRDLA